MSRLIRAYARLRWYTGAREPKRRTTREWKARRGLAEARLQQAIKTAQGYRAPSGILGWSASQQGAAGLRRGAAALALRAVRSPGRR